MPRKKLPEVSTHLAVGEGGTGLELTAEGKTAQLEIGSTWIDDFSPVELRLLHENLTALLASPGFEQWEKSTKPKPRAKRKARAEISKEDAKTIRKNLKKMRSRITKADFGATPETTPELRSPAAEDQVSPPTTPKKRRGRQAKPRPVVEGPPPAAEATT